MTPATPPCPGLLAARVLGLGDAAPAVAGAQAKLERIMPDGLRRGVDTIDETVRLELRAPSWRDRDEAA